MRQILEQICKKSAKHSLKRQVVADARDHRVAPCQLSFERRIIHVTVGDMDGIDTESVVQDGVKRVKIMLVGGEE